MNKRNMNEAMKQLRATLRSVFVEGDPYLDCETKFVARMQKTHLHISLDSDPKSYFLVKLLPFTPAKTPAKDLMKRVKEAKKLKVALEVTNSYGTVFYDALTDKKLAEYTNELPSVELTPGNAWFYTDDGIQFVEPVENHTKEDQVAAARYWCITKLESVGYTVIPGKK